MIFPVLGKYFTTSTLLELHYDLLNGGEGLNLITRTEYYETPFLWISQP